MLSMAVRGLCRTVLRAPVRRCSVNTFINELSQPRGLQAFFGKELPEIVNADRTFHQLKHQTDLATLPTVEWWAEFRQRLAGGSFHPDATNWVLIVRTVAKLSGLRIKSLGNVHVTPESLYLLPPNWYPQLVELASSCDWTQTNATAVRNLLWLLTIHRIQFNDEMQLKAAALFENYCSNTDDFIETFIGAQKCGYPISKSLWQRVADLPLDDLYGKRKINRLLDHAAKYWALWLPSAPPAVLLHRLVLTHLATSRTNATTRWYLLHLLIGDEFMPQEFLRQVSAGVQVQRGFDRTHQAPSNPELEQRLMRQHEAVKIEANVQLAALAGKTVNYLLTKADGKQKVLCDGRMIEEAYYWSVPDDVQGSPTITYRVNLYLIKRAGYEFALLKNAADENNH